MALYKYERIPTEQTGYIEDWNKYVYLENLSNDTTNLKLVDVYYSEEYFQELAKASKKALEALEWSWGGEPMSSLEYTAMDALRRVLGKMNRWENEG